MLTFIGVLLFLVVWVAPALLSLAYLLFILVPHAICVGLHAAWLAWHRPPAAR